MWIEIVYGVITTVVIVVIWIALGMTIVNLKALRASQLLALEAMKAINARLRNVEAIIVAVGTEAGMPTPPATTKPSDPGSMVN